MNRIRQNVMRALWILTFTISIAGISVAQKPEIKAVDKMQGAMQEIVTIKGAFFGTDPSKIAVTFGASKADIVSITDQILEVKVPYGTTYRTIAVTNLTTGLSGYSSQQFLLNFQGPPVFGLSNLEGQFNFPAGAPAKEGLNDLCMCDFDGDKKVDVATANENFKYINVYPNGSTTGTVSFPSKTALNIASLSLHIKCGDLNGDGKPDLVATESGATDKIFILKNVSSGVGNFSFSSPSSITLTGKRPKRIEIADLNLDGKPEVIVTSQGSNTVTILINQSSVASISFAPITPIDVSIPGAASTEGLAVEDLNGDGLPEIVTSQFQTNSNLYVIENKSAPGSFTAGEIKTLSVGTQIKNIRIGDLDGDQKPDIAFTQLISSSVGIFLNQSSNSLAFSGLQTFEADATPCGIDFGDLDGDGKIDIAIASLTKKSLTILNNKSTIGNLSFEKLIQPTTYINRHVAICDIDTDGKPDIAFTSIDDNNLNIPASKVSVFRNKTCMVPKISPEGPLHVCSGFPLVLKATKGGGVTYEWTNTTTNTTTTGTNEFSPTVSGDYVVKAISESGACNLVSNIVKITISAGTVGDPDPTNDGPTCVGQTMNLQIPDLGPGVSYEWTGPNNYTGTGITPAPVTNFRLINAGTYYVDVKAASGCIAARDSTVVKAVDLPDFKVGFTGSDVICLGDLKQLNIVPNAPGFSYQWYEKTSGIIAGATSPTYTIGASGEFYYTAISTNPGCPTVTSTSAKLKVVTLPVPLFTSPSTACKGSEISFTNQSTFDSQAPVSYSWNFGDGSISTEKDPKHIYAAVGSYPTKLTVSYSGNACPATVTNPAITITDAPPVAITTDLNKFEICPEETLVLLVAGTFTSYAWSTGSTSSTVSITEAGDYSVTVKATNGCELKATKTITELPASEVTATATPDVIDEGQSVQLEAAGLETYSWSPSETLSDATLPNPVAIPISSTTYTVVGKDVNNCKGKASVEVKVRGEAIVKKLGPKNFFSPANGDASNNFWEIDKIEEYPQCAIAIYDDKGVKVFDAKPYMNDWDGSFNGKQLPDGVYYYIIRCEGEESVPRSGSITLLR